MMACNTPFDLLNAYVDGELAPPEELELRRHLDVCEACRSQVETLVALKEAVATSAETRPLPHTLRERLGTLARGRTDQFLGRRVWRTGFAAGLLLAVGVTGWFMLHTRAHTDVVTEALVADHLHFLQDPDALEVVSEDPERIAAWFADKVSFPVRVPRLPGATLLGGRFCSLWGHEVALAFYQARGRRLSLFVTEPATFSVGPPPSGCAPGLGGYRVCLVEAAPTVLAMVADAEQTAALLPELRRAAERE